MFGEAAGEMLEVIILCTVYMKLDHATWRSGKIAGLSTRRHWVQSSIPCQGGEGFDFSIG